MLSAKETLVVVGIIFAFGMFLMYAITWKSERVAEMKNACQAKGGVLLDQTYRVGKGDQHNYVCVDPNIIITY
jgi:hypothetical protein